jgi:hypothetical protein
VPVFPFALEERVGVSHDSMHAHPNCGYTGTAAYIISCYGNRYSEMVWLWISAARSCVLDTHRVIRRVSILLAVYGAGILIGSPVCGYTAGNVHPWETMYAC